MNLSDVPPVVPLTEDRRNRIQGLALQYGFRAEWQTGTDTGRQYLIIRGGGGYSGATAALMILDAVIPRMIRTKGGMSGPDTWEQVLWCNPPAGEYLRMCEQALNSG